MRRKFTCKAHGQQIVLVKQPNEKVEHVWMKALLWALYLPTYPTARVEVGLGDRYKPDVLAQDATGAVCFWGEAGQVGEAKWRALLRRYPHTHFAWGKWATRLAPHVAQVEAALAGVARTAPVDILEFPRDSDSRFFDEHGQICVEHAALTWVRLAEGNAPSFTARA
jgi:uncharacterized protein YaeQ